MKEASGWARSLFQCFGLFVVLLIGILTPVFVLAGVQGSISLDSSVGPARSLGLARADLSLPSTDNSRLFVELSALGSTEPGVQGGIGIGFRRLDPYSQHIAGAYAAFDRRTSATGHTWDQLTLGYELIRPHFDFRMNAYFPSPSAQMVASKPDDAIVVTGTDLLFEEANINTYEQAMTGFDAELGWTYAGPESSTRAFLGGYSFHARDLPQVTGWHAGVAATARMDGAPFPNASITTKIEAKHDAVRGPRGYVGFELRFPFGPGATDGTEEPAIELHHRLHEPIRRQLNIVTQIGIPKREINRTTSPLHPITRKPVEKVWVVTAGGTGEGSLQQPASVEHVMAQAGTHDLIIFRGDGGDIDTGPGGFVMHPGQIAASSGVPLVFVSSSGREAAITFDGAPGRLTNSQPDQPILTLADSASVLGITFDGGASAIYGRHLNGIVRLRGNTISGLSGSAIDVSAGSNEDLPLHLITEGNVIDNVGGHGIAFESGPGAVIGSVEILHNHVSQTQGSAIRGKLQHAAAPTFLIAHNTITSPGQHGVSVEADLGSRIGSLEIAGNTSTAAQDHGIYLLLARGANANTLIARNAIQDAAHHGIALFADDATISVTTLANHITGSGADSVSVNGWESTFHVEVMGNEITSSANAAVSFDTDTSNLKASIMGNVIDGATYGINLWGVRRADADLTIHDNAMTNVDQEIVE